MNNNRIIKVNIIGVGTGNGQITRAAINAIESSELVFGAGRLLELCSDICRGKICVNEYKASNIRAGIEASKASNIAILVSGDTGFYSASEGLLIELSQYDISVYPGISSVCSMSSKIGIPWQDMRLISCHGRKCNLVDMVRRNRYTFALLGNNTSEILLELCKKGFGELDIFIGSNLDMDDEKLIKSKVQDMIGQDIDALSVLVVVNEAYDASALVGIPSDHFIRGDVPITKEEVRAVTMSKLRVSPDSVCIDIGCGTGSVTIEMALAAYDGKVYAIDKNPEAVSLTKENVKHFHVGNVEIIKGEGAETIAKIFGSCDSSDIPDIAFIGGSTGHLEEIIDKLLVLNPNMRIVVNAIVIETMSKAIEAFENRGMDTDITQLAVSKAKKIGSSHMMMTENNIYIIKGEK